MKKRIVALLLCCVMLLTLSPSLIATATADDETTPAQTEVTVSPAKADLPRNKKVTLTAQAKDAKSYQWQIMAEDDLWVDISGETERTIQVSYAMVASLLDGSKAQLRCKTDLGTTDPATVTVTEAQAVAAAPAKAAPKAGTVTKGAEAINSAVVQASEGDAVANDETVIPGETTGDEPDTYTIVINYVFEDGKQAANPWTATVAKGSSYAQAVTSPTVLGYAPDQESVNVNVENAQADTTYKVTYKPAKVDFTVKHYQQNVSNDQYTLVDTETKKGYTEAAVGESLATTYKGFYSLLYDTTTKIAADSSTVVEIYYDRYYYLMNFDLDGGYGVEPIYARYGAAINLVAPTKPGYTFTGWDKEIPKTMPAENTTFKASWKIGESGFTVVFWYQNANDDGYSVAGTHKPANVAPGTQKKSEDYKDQSFTGRDDKHFTYNTEKVETVTVKGDGSTVLNVYYTRNTYTLTFKDGNIKIVCDKVEHKHSHEQCCTKTGRHLSCNSKKCPVGYEHTHRNSCYKTSDLTITAKYQADIHGNFPINAANGDTILWSVPSGCTSFKPGTYLASINEMPGENITFTKYDEVSAATIYYYVESLAGKTGVYTHDGKQFDLYKKVKYTKSGYLTYAEEFHDITGFTQWWSDPKFSSFDQNGSTSTIKAENYLCYTRNSYKLSFYNVNAFVTGKGGSVQYEAPLNGYDFTPAYPANLEKNAYVFDGWYTTSSCYEGSEADLSTMTMPASDVILYAKWTPKTHTVKTYLTKDVLDDDGNPLDTWNEVPHGTTIANPPADPTRKPYTFVSWFYISDTGEEKAFDFSMPVNRDLNLYAKWRSDSLMEYTIRYELADGTEIAPPTTGSALAGTTKTFNAKTGTQLNKDYQSGYFPNVSSHSITIDIEGTAENKKNEFTFVYVAKPEVEYTVKYLEKGTEKQLADPKTVTTSDAVVTETFKQITGYAPDAYQKQLVLAAEGNEIIFWYVKDDVHAPVHIVHWIQNIAGDGYTEYQSSTNLNGVIGTKYSETPLDIPGFKYNGAKSNSSGKLTAAGLVLNLYYDRIEYPYEFRFLEQGTDKKLADPVTGNARYQAQVTQTAKDIPGYTLVSAENQAINIAIENPANVASKNVKIFYYTEQTVDIKYVVVGPDGCGTLDNYQESQLKVITGTPTGSVAAKANDNFKFVGWYKDEACTQPVDSSWVANNKLTPGRTKNYGTAEKPVMGYEAATYYAKFDYDITDLTITKTYNNMLDPNQSAVFTVTGDGTSIDVVIHGNGRVVIKGLKVGTTYTVTEKTGWTWRYTTAPTSQNSRSIQLVAGEGINTITFTNTLTKNKWLTGGAWCDNVWGKSPNKSTSTDYSGK